MYLKLIQFLYKFVFVINSPEPIQYKKKMFLKLIYAVTHLIDLVKKLWENKRIYFLNASNSDELITRK